ncbi:hypothetical protein GCM10022285_58340 [Streptomyces tunisiensis]|uniref:Transposase n=1 Tax=Streptomyces tunisiensis TaxID=948699 RepID=A0ABP7Z7N2_9ACTN
MVHGVAQQKLLALLRIASRQREARQKGLRTGDRIQRNAGQLARVVERFHPIREVLLRIRTANPFLRPRDPKCLGDLGWRHPELQRPHTDSQPQLPALPLRVPAHPPTPTSARPGVHAAGGDSRRPARTPLVQARERPGSRMRRGLAVLDLAAGDVTEAQPRNLFGEGQHPHADRIEAGPARCREKPAAARRGSCRIPCAQ